MDVDEAINQVLAHHGVKGMHWGIRKSSDAPNLKPTGVTINRDGSMVIKKGSNIQRLVTSPSSKFFSRPMKDLTYASIHEIDNARYLKILGGKGFLAAGNDTILSIRTTKEIKAPSFNEAVKINSNLMLKNPEFRDTNKSSIGRSISSRELDSLKKDPTGKTATAWYDHTSQNLIRDAKDYPDIRIMQKHFREEFKANGFNAVRDENDFRLGLSAAPIIIFNPETSLKVIKMTRITDDIRKANKEQLKSYKKNGKAWIDRQIYGD